MFDSLSRRLGEILKGLRRRGRLTPADVEEGLREIRRALLEADVNYKVAKRLCDRVREKALTSEVLESLTPGQQLVKIVHEELARLMAGGEVSQGQPDLTLEPKPAVVMLVGLQGSGKTTTAGKLARYLHQRRGLRPLLVATDVRRPAAREQLEQLGAQLGYPVFTGTGDEGDRDPVRIARQAVEEARRSGADLLVIDTAGRLQIDEAMMAELVELKGALRPQEVLLVADAMTGQEALSIAQAFHERVGLTGLILTKLDGDARGGAALSMAEVTGLPIKFIGTGEKLDDLEPFHPERLAGRILGMGDILSLIEEAEARLDRKKAEEAWERLQKDQFTLEDFLEQLQQLRRMGPLRRLLEKLPGMGASELELELEEKELTKAIAIIQSMTPEERRNPRIIDGSRKRRIARGSGTRVSDVNRLLKQVRGAQKLMKQLGKLEMGRGGRQRQRRRQGPAGPSFDLDLDLD